MKIQYGRHFYGLAGIVFGVLTLVGHQIDSLGNTSHPAFLVYVVGFVEIVAGLALQWEKTMKYGALFLGTIFLLFTVYWIPYIVETPLIYWHWGNFFEQLSVVLGGTLVFASTLRNDPEWAEKIGRIAYRIFGVCSVSFMLYQLFYLQTTAELIPTWIPPGQMFWAIATTFAFALAAVAINTGRSAVLAARLVVAMLICFCPLVWLPRYLNDPHEWSNWIRNAETLAVAGSVWIVADYLVQWKKASFA